MTEQAGVYIHVPFCIQKCLYCDFYSETRLTKRGDFVSAVISEILQSQGSIDVDTIYFGGGTPSVLDAEDIGKIIGAVNSRFNVSKNTEVTLETNPKTVGAIRLKEFYHAGVNRLNIGIQSFSDSDLQFLGRPHTSRDGYNAINDAIRAGFENIGIDLIYGLPEQTLKMWERQLLHPALKDIQHMSCYSLTYEEGTPLYEFVAQQKIIPLDDDTVAAMVCSTEQVLKESGFLRYEVSNFAKPSFESRHNRKYWNLVPYYGFGPGAHSFHDNKRWWNNPNLDAYIHSHKTGSAFGGGSEDLSRSQEITEYILVRLRTVEGFISGDFKRRFGFDPTRKIEPYLSPLISAGLVSINPDGLSISPDGWPMMDAIIGRIAMALDS